MDFYINLYGRHGLDSNWLKELKNVVYPENGIRRPLAVHLRKQNNGWPVRASYIPFDNVGNSALLTFNLGTVGKRQMNLNSNVGVTRFLHELYHAYQNYVLNMEWRDASVDKDANTYLDLDAYKKQFEIEDLLRIPKSSFRTQFEGYESQGLPDEKAKEFQIRAIDNIREKAEERRRKNRSKQK